MEQNVYKPYKIILITFFSICVNFFGRVIADYYQLPLWLDSFGTFLMAYIYGPVCGVIVGITGNFIYAFKIPVSAIYSITSVFIALIFGEMSKRGWMNKFYKAITLSVLVSYVCVTISTILNVIFYDGKTGNIWGDGIIELLEKWSVPFFIRAFLGQFYLDFLDKLITIVFLYAFIKIYRLVKPVIKKKIKKSLESIPGKSALMLLSFCMLSVFCAGKLSAENYAFNSYVRTIYNKANGLPCGEANDIAFTDDGIMWIGTYAGLYRHNGRDFRLMNDFPSIKTVKCLYVDNEGRLFVGTNDDGLSVMINEEIFYEVNETNGLPSDSIRCVTRAPNSYYYVGTSAGMAVLSIADKMHLIATIPEIESAVRVCADSINHIAAVTADGKLFVIHGTEIAEHNYTGIEKITAIAFSEDNLLYAATETNRILVFEPDAENAADGAGCNLIQKQEYSCGNLNQIKSIDFKQGVAFLCADNGAGYLKDGTFFELETGDFNNSIDHMSIDYQGNLWFSSSRLGLLKMCKSSFVDIFHAAGFEETVVNSINKFNGELYFGTDSGLFFIDKNTAHSGENALTEKLANVRVRCLFTDSAGNMWICTKSKGLISVTPDGIITEVASGHMRVAIELSDGVIAAGGNAGVVFIKDNKEIARITVADGFENPVVLSLSECADGTVLAGTDGGGIAVIRNYKIETLIKKSDGLSSSIILRTVNDNDMGIATGNVFVVTSNGLCYLEKKEDAFEIKILSKFPYSNNFDLVVNKDNNIFVLGSAGIYVVRREALLSDEKPDYELLDIKKGLFNSITANSWNYIDEDSNLYICCDRGASFINLYSYNQIVQSYRLQLKNVIVDGKRQIVQKDVPFEIPADTKTLEIEPEIINYSINNPYVKLYIDGVDENPVVMLQSEVTNLIYKDLRSGEHHFYMEVLDSHTKSILEKNPYIIKKPSHIYDNWWFLVYAVIVLVIYTTWITWHSTSTIQRRRIRRQAEELESIKNQVRMGNETIFAIANAVEARDKRTGHHSWRVAEYSVLIARELGFNDEELENIRKIGLLHDIGKIGVPDNILNKAAPLTDEEYKIMKSHVVTGSEILKDFTIIKNVADGAKYHHERYDGSGYNEGLKGEKIPLTARIIGISDAFDAMTANRVYRKALSMDTVIEEIKRCRGAQFDPGLVDILLELLENGTINVEEMMRRSEESAGSDREEK